MNRNEEFSERDPMIKNFIAVGVTAGVIILALLGSIAYSLFGKSEDIPRHENIRYTTEKHAEEQKTTKAPDKTETSITDVSENTTAQTTLPTTDVSETVQSSEISTSEVSQTTLPQVTEPPSIAFIEPPEQTVTYQKPTAKVLGANDIYNDNYKLAVNISCKTSYDSALFGQTYEAISFGTGFFIAGKGYIATSYAVTENATQITVTTYDGTTYSAELIGEDKDSGLSVLKIDAESTPYASFGSAKKLAPGDELVIIANPYSSSAKSFTKAKVVIPNKTVTIGGAIHSVFTTDAEAYTGSGGSAVFDSTGKLVGMVVTKIAQDGSVEDSFCFLSDDMIGPLLGLAQYGYVRNRATLGISVKSVSDGGINGCLIVKTEASYGAAKAGLTENDLITAINGESTATVEQLKLILSKHVNGETVSIKIIRDGKEIFVDVPLSERLPSAPRTNDPDVSDV